MPLKHLSLFVLFLFLTIINGLAQEKEIQYTNWQVVDIVSDYVRTVEHSDYIVGGPEVKQLDTEGAEFLFFISPKSDPTCRQLFRVGWTFDTDISKLEERQTINIQLFNNTGEEDSSGIRSCYRAAKRLINDDTWLTLSFKGGIKASLHENPDYSWYWGEKSNHLFTLSNSTTAYPVYNKEETFVASITVRDGQDTIGTTNAPFGSLVFEIEKRDVFRFEVLYLFYGEESDISPAGAHRLRIDKPEVIHNVNGRQGGFEMNLFLPGLIDEALGRDLQIMMHFIDGYGRPMPAYPGDTAYNDGYGNAAVRSPSVKVNDKRFDLLNVRIWMPYYALNLPKTGTRGHIIWVYAEVYLDEKIIGVSKPVQTLVVW